MLKIWGRPTSTCTQRVLWTLVEASVPYQLTLASATMGAAGHIMLGHTPYGVVDTLDYRAMNPNGTIPTIEDNGFILWESNAIVAYIARQYAAMKLYEADEKTFVTALKWMMWTNYSLESPMHLLITHLERLPIEQRNSVVVSEQRLEMLTQMRIIETQLKNSRYLTGHRFTIADIPPAIAIQRFVHCDLSPPSMPLIEDWLGRISERVGFREHVASRHLHFSDSK
jgi:glutathione S-transferase